MKPTTFAEMFRLVLLLFLIIQTVKGSSILVKDGVYSRVTVQIQDQPQPSSCVAFLDHLEVREHFFVVLHVWDIKKHCGIGLIFFVDNLNRTISTFCNKMELTYCNVLDLWNPLFTFWTFVYKGQNFVKMKLKMSLFL